MICQYDFTQFQLIIQRNLYRISLMIDFYFMVEHRVSDVSFGLIMLCFFS